MELVEGIDFIHSNRKAWKTLNCLSGHIARPTQCPVTANSITHQLPANGRYVGASKTHSLAVKHQCHALWNSLGVMSTSHQLSHRRNWPMPSNCSSARKLKSRTTYQKSSFNTLHIIAYCGCGSSTPVVLIVLPFHRSGKKRQSQPSKNQTNKWTISVATENFAVSRRS